jgi:DNA-binding PadR family transcriptional regulator
MPTLDPTTFLPLREPTFFILLALVPGDRHGYSMLKDVEILSEGKIRLSTGTLYEALSRLLEQGLVERVENEAQPADLEASIHPGKPRKHYHLTREGLLVLEAETARLRRLVAAAQHQLRAQQ